MQLSADRLKWNLLLSYVSVNTRDTRIIIMSSARSERRKTQDNLLNKQYMFISRGQSDSRKI